MTSGRVAKVSVPILILAVGAVLVANQNSPHKVGSPASSNVVSHGLFNQGPFTDSSPLGGAGVEVPLATAISKAPFHISRPADSAGSDQTITGVWVRTGDLPEVVLHYQSGLEAYVTPWDNAQSPSDFYQKQINEGVPGTLVTVGGMPGLAIPATAAGPPSLDFVVRGINVVLINKTGALSINDLLRAGGTVS